MHNDEKNKNVKCKSCKQNFVYEEDNCKMHEYSSYSQKITKCPYCDKHVVVKTFEDRALYVNSNADYYSYW